MPLPLKKEKERERKKATGKWIKQLTLLLKLNIPTQCTLIFVF
jgi:hypothetical protein